MEPHTHRPDSPCRGLCTTTYTDICSGCGRHFTEVSGWVFLSEDEKIKVWERLQQEGWCTLDFKPTTKCMGVSP